MSKSRDNLIGILFLFFVALCWGFVASTVKRLTANVDPYTISFFRVFLASVVFVIAFVIQRGDWRRLRWWLPWILIGAVGRAGNYLLYNAGLVNAPSNAVTILAPAQTISMILLARWVIGERVRHKWLGLLLSLGGLALIWWNGQPLATLFDPAYFWGQALLALAGISSALQFISQKVLSDRFSSLEILIPVFGLSTLLTTPFAIQAGGFGRAYSASTWGLLLFLGFIITGGSFFALAEGYRRCSASTAVVITNSSIFLTLLFSHYLMNESVGAIMIVGALLGIGGTIAVVQAERAQIRAESAGQQTGHHLMSED